MHTFLFFPTFHRQTLTTPLHEHLHQHHRPGLIHLPLHLRSQSLQEKNHTAPRTRQVDHYGTGSHPLVRERIRRHALPHILFRRQRLYPHLYPRPVSQESAEAIIRDTPDLMKCDIYFHTASDKAYYRTPLSIRDIDATNPYGQYMRTDDGYYTRIFGFNTSW